MANGYVNTVPLGQVGTGAAYVLGPNMALQQWMGRVEQDRNLRQQQAQQAQNIRYQNQRSFNQALASLPQSTGRMYNRDLQELVSGVTQEGARLMAQGVNPFAPNYNDPNQAQASQRFIQDFNQAQNAVSYIQSLEKERNDTLKRYAASPDEFDYDDYQRILNFENETPIQDVLSGQAQLPVLGKSFNVVRDIVNPLGTMSRQVKRVERGPEGDVTVDETIADIPRITDAVKSAYTAGPGANYLSRRLNEAGLTGARADGILGTTDESEIRQFLDEEFRVPSENNPVVELMAQGRIPAIGSEEYNRFLDDSVKTQLRAERVADKVFNDAIKLSASKVNPKYSEMPNFDYQREIRSQESAERARRAEGRAIEARNEARARFNERSDNQLSEEPVDLMIPYGPYNPEGIQPQVQARNYIPMSVPNRNFVGSEAIDLYTGRPTQIGESSADYSIVGVAQVPVSKNPIKGGVPKGSLVQPGFASSNPGSVEWKQVVHVTKGDGEDYFVDINRLPKNLTKDQKALVDRFKQAAGGNNTSGTQLSAEELIRKYSQ